MIKISVTIAKISYTIMFFAFTILHLSRYVKDGQHLHLLGQKMEDLIFNVADSNFFFNDLEECDQVVQGFGALSAWIDIIICNSILKFGIIKFDKIVRKLICRALSGSHR